MTSDDGESLFSVLDLIAEVYQRNVSAEHKALFFRILQRFDFPAVVSAFDTFMGTPDYGKYGFPKPAQIVEIIEGSEADRESGAFMTLTRAVERIGVWKSVIVEDPVLADAVVAVYGGWVQACEMKHVLGDVGWNVQRREFVAGYRNARRVLRPTSEPKILSGQCAQQNGESRSSWQGDFVDAKLRDVYGVIRLDGTVENKYLDIELKTGLPVAPIPDVLALPPAQTQRLLSASTDDEPMIDPPDVAKAKLKEIFSRLGAVTAKKTWPKPRPMTGAEEEARKAYLREQAHGESSQSTGALRAQGHSKGRRGEETDSDRDSVQGGGFTVSGDGVQVRETAGPELATGLRVAGTPDRLRDRRRNVRPDDHGATGLRAQKGRRSRTDRAGHTVPSRRKT